MSTDANRPDNPVEPYDPDDDPSSLTDNADLQTSQAEGEDPDATETH